jgi:hypothetical protein
MPRRGIRPLPRGNLKGTPEKGTPDTKVLDYRLGFQSSGDHVRSTPSRSGTATPCSGAQRGRELLPSW